MLALFSHNSFPGFFLFSLHLLCTTPWHCCSWDCPLFDPMKGFTEEDKKADQANRLVNSWLISSANGTITSHSLFKIDICPINSCLITVCINLASFKEAVYTLREDAYITADGATQIITFNKTLASSILCSPFPQRSAPSGRLATGQLQEFVAQRSAQLYSPGRFGGCPPKNDWISGFSKCPKETFTTKWQSSLAGAVIMMEAKKGRKGMSL